MASYLSAATNLGPVEFCHVNKPLNFTMSRLSNNLHHFLTEDVLEELMQRKIITVIDFVESDSDLLVKITRLEFKQILAIKDAILVKYASKMRTGYSFNKEILNKNAIIPSGVKKLDDILNGGFYTGFMYELTGFSSTGKSQICMSMAVNVSAECQKEVLFIDTKRDLSADRLISIMGSKFQQVGETLSRILVSQPATPYELIGCLHDYIVKAAEKNVRLVIVDSLAALFYQLVGDHQETVSLLSSVSSLLQYIAVELHTAVVVTNLSTTWQGLDTEEKQKSALGKYWAHVPSTRLSLSRLSGVEILVTVTKSFTIAIGTSITLSLTDRGVH